MNHAPFLLLTAAALALPVAPAAELPGPLPPWVTPAVSGPGLQQRIFASTAAKTDVSYHLYTPPAYASEKTRRFPVLYWLHGTGGGLEGIPKLAAHFHAAIHSGKTPPMLVVFPNGRAASMWCDSKDGQVPMETVVMEELIPHIDATFRTIASREGRLIEGFSMGGYGAARLGFKHPQAFGAISILGAGPLDLDFTGPRATSKPGERDYIFESVWGSDLDFYRAQSPWRLAEQNQAALAANTRIRLAVGTRDAMLAGNRDLDAHLTGLGVPHDFTELPGVGHHPLSVFSALGEANWKFYRAAFAADPAHRSANAASPKRSIFFGFSKAMLADGVPQQQRAWDAVQAIQARLAPLGYASHLLQEPVQSHAGGPAPFQVNRERIAKELESWRQNLGPGDTIIVYSHSHGVQGRTGRLGGLPLDDPSTGLPRPLYLTWKEYADQLLRLPAQTVLVLTMACHSGGLVEFLNSDEQAKSSWQHRREQGRNFLVITSQNAHSLSTPRQIDGQLINPFTHAVIQAFGGAADGYPHRQAEAKPDGQITLGELAAYLLDETKRHRAPGGQRNAPEPQLTGSFAPETVVATLSPVKTSTPSPPGVSTGNTGQR